MSGPSTVVRVRYSSGAMGPDTSSTVAARYVALYPSDWVAFEDTGNPWPHTPQAGGGE